jgi:hypothetical protein
MKIIKLITATTLALLLTVFSLLLLPFLAMWFVSAYSLLFVLGFSQEILKGKI